MVCVSMTYYQSPGLHNDARTKFFYIEITTKNYLGGKISIYIYIYIV